MNKMADTENPPFSRLFVMGDKQTSDKEYEEEFGKIGVIEYVFRVKDKATGEPKGLVYIKMTKTSSAARAVEELNGKVLKGANRPLKVIIASKKSAESPSDEDIMAQISRLFLVIPKEYTEDNLKQIFDKYGEIKKIFVVKDKQTRESKGLAYITFEKASDAAAAYEGCSQDFKPKFADPVSRKRRRSESEKEERHSMGRRDLKSDRLADSHLSGLGPKDYLTSYPHSNQNMLKVRIPKGLTQMQLTRLFNIVPTLEYCRLVTNQYSATDYAMVRYSSPNCCAYAREAFNGFEYPPGCPLECEYTSEEGSSSSRDYMGNQSSSYWGSNAGWSGYSQTDYDNFSAPAADINHHSGEIMKKRLFVVSQPERVPQETLFDLFGRFGDMISFSYIPGKNFGFAKFASEASADRAKKALHGEMICGNRLKVLDAEEPPGDKKRKQDQD